MSGFAISIRPDKSVTPHNGVLFVALGGGVVALLFFFGYWVLAFCGARRATPKHPDSAYLLPLLTYCFITMLWSSAGFMTTFSTATVCMCLHHFGLRGGNLLRNRVPIVNTKGPQNRVFIASEF